MIFNFIYLHFLIYKADGTRSGRGPGQQRPHLPLAIPRATMQCVKTVTGDPIINAMTQDIVVGTWNVRTLHAVGKLKELTHELQRYKRNIIGLSEVRWSGMGEMTTKEKHKYDL